MKRLLRIGFNSAIFSFIPILSWMLLGVLVDSNLSNVFSLTYPLQFIYSMLISVFAVGANICCVKTKDENHVLSGITLGTIVGFVIFGFVALNIDYYIRFMNMEPSIYREFALYSVIQLWIHSVFAFVLEKLYYEGKDKLANKYCIILNSLNLFTLIITSIVFDSKVLIVFVTLLIIFCYVLFVVIKQYKKFKFRFNIIDYFKYDSVVCVNSIFFFLIFLFGLSNSFEFGVEYAVALNFVAIITDTQWDALGAISTVAKIDISKGCFNYKEHKRNAYKLLFILLSTTVLLFIVFYRFYELDMKLFLIYLSFELINFSIYPIYQLKTVFLQLEYSVVKITTNEIIATGGRMLISLLKTPFCTGIGQVVSSIYQFISLNIIFKNNFIVSEDGNIIEK